MKLAACVVSVLVLAIQVLAADAPSASAVKPEPSAQTVPLSDVAHQLEAMRATLQAQQQQIEALQRQLKEQNQAAIAPEVLTPGAKLPSSSLPSSASGSGVAFTPRIPESGPVVQDSAVIRTASLSSPAPATPAPAVPQATSTPPQQASNTINLAQGKLQIGGVVYADWSSYPQTGFGPAFLDLPETYPGPGNDGYNAFNVSRTYVNLLYSPADYVTFRITPDIFRDSSGNLTWRLKYGYGEFHNIFGGAIKGDNIRFGQQVNPLIDWEEALYGYRFVSLVPWNFISLSSTYTGVSLNGPVKGSNGRTYLDYQVGVFNNANFHANEQAENKTFMARASFYPMGAKSRFDGLGLTAFIDYGYNNKIPSTPSIPVLRGAALASYMSPKNGAQIAFEYDFGRNAMSNGNLFGGSGSPTGIYVGAGDLATAILGMQDAKQEGYDVFGHVNLGPTKWAAFGLFQDWRPNTKIPDNPLDFRRVVAGLSYTVNKNVRIALDSQDVLYKHSQFTYPNATLATFSPAAAAKYPAGVANAVPPSVKAVFLNMEFTF